MNFQEDVMYTESHEWIKFIDETTVLIGITDFAQHELGDLVFVNLPQIDDALTVGKTFADVESVKAVSDVFSPVSGIVCEVNQDLLDAPQMINEAPYLAWLIKVSNISEQKKMLNLEQYREFVAQESEK
ncbi:MAG TPA: glycine cleavage system protein GcvH [Ruminiclostridium sp.]